MVPICSLQGSSASVTSWGSSATKQRHDLSTSVSRSPGSVGGESGGGKDIRSSMWGEKENA